MRYEIEINKTAKGVRHEWSTEGYKLSMLSRPDADNMFWIGSPTNAPDIVIDNFDKERKLEIVGTSGEAAPWDDAQFAETNIAVRIASEFQKIVDSFK